MRTNQVAAATQHPRQNQFGLRALFEYLSVSGVLLAASRSLGLATGACLMGVALALAARRGGLTIAALAAAALAADWQLPPQQLQASWLGQVVVFAAAAGLCAWYGGYRRHSSAVN